MAGYGRNFEFRISPPPDQRLGRYRTGEDPLPIGTPVAVVGTAVDAQGRLEVGLAAAGTAPVKGQTGLLIFEHAWAATAGYDPALTDSADIDYAPAMAPVQLVSGNEVKVCFRNTVDRTFPREVATGRAYAGRLFVAPAGLAGVNVGDLIGPGAGTDDGGYWAVVAGDAAAPAWFSVTSVDPARAEVEAQMLF